MVAQYSAQTNSRSRQTTVEPEAGTAAWVAELRHGELPQKQPAYQDLARAEPSSVLPIRRSSGQYKKVARLEGVFEAPRVADLKPWTPPVAAPAASWR